MTKTLEQLIGHGLIIVKHGSDGRTYVWGNRELFTEKYGEVMLFLDEHKAACEARRLAENARRYDETAIVMVTTLSSLPHLVEQGAVAS